MHHDLLRLHAEVVVLRQLVLAEIQGLLDRGNDRILHHFDRLLDHVAVLGPHGLRYAGIDVALEPVDPLEIVAGLIC